MNALTSLTEDQDIKDDADHELIVRFDYTAPDRLRYTIKNGATAIVFALALLLAKFAPVGVMTDEALAALRGRYRALVQDAWRNRTAGRGPDYQAMGAETAMPSQTGQH